MENFHNLTSWFLLLLGAAPLHWILNLSRLCGESLSTKSSKLSFSKIWTRDEFTSRRRKYLSSLLDRSIPFSSMDFLEKCKQKRNESKSIDNVISASLAYNFELKTDLGYTSIANTSLPTWWSSLIRINFPESLSVNGYSLVGWNVQAVNRKATTKGLREYWEINGAINHVVKFKITLSTLYCTIS